MSKLLINEQPLQVLPALAKKIGLNEAIAIQQIHYWIENKKNEGRIHNGHKWVYNTYDEWRDDNFPFWSVSTIQRVFTSLEKSGLLFAEKLDQHKRDMTKFYRPNYVAIDTLEDVNLTRSNKPKRHDVNKNTETTAKITSEATEELKEGTKEKIAPRVPATIEEAIIYGGDIPEDQVGEDAQFNSDVQDAAWLICQGAEDLKPLAIAFMEERRLILHCEYKTEISGHRKALRQMINSKPNAVTADHVREGVQTMLKARLSIKNLFSVVAAAVEAANPPPTVETEQDDDFDVL